MKPFSNETLNFFLQKFLFLLHFGSCQNCMSSSNLVAEIYQKLCNKSILSTGEPCTYECYFAPVISQRYIKYTVVHSSKTLAYIFHVRLIQTIIQDCHLYQILSGGYSIYIYIYIYIYIVIQMSHTQNFIKNMIYTPHYATSSLPGVLRISLNYLKLEPQPTIK